ncbi:FimV/HubP family polar landmark protein [Stenoxybacter acetivorans]|uniref:FimV/HubP family polar landmark protein n=1 Tax=Stenoxybacter acetivorans TaxID=422441 RepID=UPI000566A5F5|nr:FimV/HubP family polar landmark protein [Stenoxybacter acetivorans]
MKQGKPLKKIALSLCVSALAAPSFAGLGNLQVHSSLGEPFSGSIIASGEQAQTLMNQRRLTITGAVFQAQIVPQGNNVLIRLRSNQPIREPMLAFSVSVDGQSRQYTALLDPPASAAAIPAPAQNVGGTAVLPKNASSTPFIPPTPISNEAKRRAAQAEALSMQAPSSAARSQAATEQDYRVLPNESLSEAKRRAAQAEALSMQAPVSSARSQALAGQNYRILPSENLIDVARKVQPAGLTLMQTVRALARANPHAFRNNNPNLMYQNVTLNIPTADRMQQLAFNDAPVSPVAPRNQSAQKNKPAVAKAPPVHAIAKTPIVNTPPVQPPAVPSTPPKPTNTAPAQTAAPAVTPPPQPILPAPIEQPAALPASAPQTTLPASEPFEAIVTSEPIIASAPLSASAEVAASVPVVIELEPISTAQPLPESEEGAFSTADISKTLSGLLDNDMVRYALMGGGGLILLLLLLLFYRRRKATAQTNDDGGTEIPQSDDDFDDDDDILFLDEDAGTVTAVSVAAAKPFVADKPATPPVNKTTQPQNDEEDWSWLEGITDKVIKPIKGMPESHEALPTAKEAALPAFDAPITKPKPSNEPAQTESIDEFDLTWDEPVKAASAAISTHVGKSAEPAGIDDQFAEENFEWTVEEPESESHTPVAIAVADPEKSTSAKEDLSWLNFDSDSSNINMAQPANKQPTVDSTQNIDSSAYSDLTWDGDIGFDSPSAAAEAPSNSLGALDITPHDTFAEKADIQGIDWGSLGFAESNNISADKPIASAAETSFTKTVDKQISEPILPDLNDQSFSWDTITATAAEPASQTQTVEVELTTPNEFDLAKQTDIDVNEFDHWNSTDTDALIELNDDERIPMEAKLELAKMYLEQDDAKTARTTLRELIDGAKGKPLSDARRLLRQLGG